MYAGVSQHLRGALESDGEGGTQTMLRAMRVDKDRNESCDKRARRIIFSYFAACFAAWPPARRPAKTQSAIDEPLAK